MSKIIIIGNGVAGVTTALELRKLDSDIEIILVSDENEFFFSRTALMYVYMGHMKFEHTQPYENDFWKKNNITLLKTRIEKIIPENNQVLTIDKTALDYDFLVIASGSKPNKFGWPGQDLEGVSGLYLKSDLEYLEKRSSNIQSAVIVGGGLIGVELAEMLLSRGKKVTFLVRESSFWNPVLSEKEGRFLEKHLLDHKVDLLLETELKSINGDKEVQSITTTEGLEIKCEYVGLTVGVSPNIDFLKGSGIEINRGVLVDPYLQTNYKNIYAAGDCAEVKFPKNNRRPIEAVWYTGKKMGKYVAENIINAEKNAYDPGHWFNSAKFFDIEYQTYGDVPAQINDTQKEFYWEKDLKSIRIVFEVHNRIFLGINTFGIRMRQQYFDFALENNWTVDRVVAELPKANFDPEFYRKYEKEIKNEFLTQIA